MVKNAIKIYGRIKPVMKRKDAGHYYIQEGNKEDTLFLQVREREAHDDHKTELNQFRFYKVFDQHIRQHEIFTTVAKPIVDSALQGYNGTVFAYGQTGSGKTFTITGGPDDFEDRGLIPRAIEYVFRKISTAEGCLYTVCVTYLQIYNEAAYDLLGQHPRMARLEDLPRLNLLDDTEGYLHIRNLSLHPVGSEHEALNLLFLGDTNRAIAETPMNQASSRSHCMFTVHLAIRKTTWKSARRAKLHFVDLAGSERVHKKGEMMDGRRLNEARHINLSLHYLEQVITALAESKRTHVPYRNCVITTMLRDSIGGNCLTSMVATLSLDSTHLPETLATCRFAQRVALVKNDATLNEDRDPMQEVSVLKSEVKRLKEQIRMLTEDKHKFEGPLSHVEEDECKDMVEAFLEDSGSLDLPLDLRKIEFCCHLLKKAVEEAKRNKGGLDEGSRNRRNSMHVEKCMEELLQQRNDEIAILTELLRKEKRKRSKTASLVTSRSLSPPMQRPSFEDYNKIMRHAGLPLNKHDQIALRKYVSNPCHAAELNNLRMQIKNRHHAAKKIHDKIEENKARIVESRKMIVQMELEMPSSPSVARKSKHMHAQIKQMLEEEQAKYRTNLGILRDLKNECDHLTRSIKQAEVRFIHNFQNWLSNQGDLPVLGNDCDQEIPQKLVESSQELLQISQNQPEEHRGNNDEREDSFNNLTANSLTPPQSSKNAVASSLLTDITHDLDTGYESAMPSTASSTMRSNIGVDIVSDLEILETQCLNPKMEEYVAYNFPQKSQIKNDEQTLLLSSILQEEIKSYKYSETNGAKPKNVEENYGKTEDAQIDFHTPKSTTRNKLPNHYIPENKGNYNYSLEQELQVEHEKQESYETDNLNFSLSMTNFLRDSGLTDWLNIKQTELKNKERLESGIMNNQNPVDTTKTSEDLIKLPMNDEIHTLGELLEENSTNELEFLSEIFHKDQCTFKSQTANSQKKTCDYDSKTWLESPYLTDFIKYTSQLSSLEASTESLSPRHKDKSSEGHATEQEPSIEEAINESNCQMEHLFPSDMTDLLNELLHPKHTQENGIAALSGIKTHENLGKVKTQNFDTDEIHQLLEPFSTDSTPHMDNIQEIFTNIFRVTDQNKKSKNNVETFHKGSSSTQCTTQHNNSNHEERPQSETDKTVTKDRMEKQLDSIKCENQNNGSITHKSSTKHSKAYLAEASSSSSSPQLFHITNKISKKTHKKTSLNHNIPISNTNNATGCGDSVDIQKQIGCKVKPSASRMCVPEKQLITEKRKDTNNSKEESNSSHQLNLHNIPLTGDPEVDEEILAFYRAKQKALLGQN